MTNVRLSRSRRLLGTLVVAVLGASSLIAARRPLAVKGISYRVKVDTKLPNFVFGGGGAGGSDAGGGGGFPGGFGGGQVQLVRVDLAGDRAKVEFQVGSPPGSSITDYFLILLDSNKVYRINPEAQTFSDASLAPGAGGRGGRGQGGGGNANRGGRGGNNNGGDNGGRRGGGFINPFTILADALITDMKTNVEDLGIGDAIDTRPTKHYKITIDYGFKLYGQPKTAKTTTEVWTVDFPERVVNPFEAATAIGDSGTIADVTRRLVAEAKKLPGVPVKVVTTQTIPVSATGADQVEETAAGGVAQTVNIVRTTVITALKQTDIDETGLAVPAGYKKVAAFGRGGGQ